MSFESKMTEQKYRDLFEKAGEAVLVFVEGKTVFHNPASRNLFGMSEDEPTGLSIGAFVHPEDRDMVLDYYRRRLEGEELPRSYLFRIVRRDGAVRWVEARPDLIDWDGERATLVFLTDTTERKTAEQAIAEGAEKFRILFENSPDAIVLMDENKCVDGNEAALKLLGCERKDELVGRSLRDFSPKNQPDGRLSQDVMLDANDTVTRQGSSRFEWLLRSPDGREIWIEVSQTAVPIGGRPILHTVLRDVTKRKKAEISLRESEERYRNIYENSQDGIFQCSPLGCYLNVNPAYARMYGYESPDRMMGAEDSAGKLYVDPEDERRFREQLRRDGEVRNFESKRRRRDDSVFWASTSAHRVIGHHGEVICHEGIIEDITDLKKTQEALRESEEQFRSLADNAGLGIYLIQEDVFRYVNKKFADTYGYGVDEIVDKMGSMDLVIPDDAAIMAENMAKRISGEVDFINYELRVPTKNGEVITVEIHGGRTVRQGRPAVIGTVQDITDRKRSEEALKRAESKYRSIFEDALMGIFQTTPAGRIVAANPAFSRMLGYASPEDLMNSITDLATQLYVRPEDRLRFHGILSSGQLVEELDTEFRKKDGSVLSVRMNARAVKDARGDILRYEGSAADITARKEAEEALRMSEQRFRSLVETTSDWIWEVDQGGVYTYASPKIKDILGYEPAEVVGRTPFDFMDPCDAERVGAIFSDLAQAGKSFSSLENTNTCKDGRKAVLETSGVPIFDGNGNLSGYRGIDRDVTKRRLAEEVLRWKTTFLEALVDSSQDGILVLDSRKQKVLQNHRLVEMWRMPPEVAETGDEEGRINFLMASIKNPEEFYTKLMHLYDHPDDTVRSEFELKTGGVVEALSYPVLSKDSMEHYGRIWMFRDITEIRRYWDMLENLSTTDGLTGISNRRRFDEFLGREWRRSMRDRSELSLLIIDIDYFKQFNDRYGHLSGDDCLKHVADALRKTVRRAGDLVARYGGEEFVCVLSGTGEKGAIEVGRKVASEIAGLKIPHEGSTVAEHVTVSIGVATEVPERGQEYSDLIRKADRSLYAAKQKGRNRVEAVPNDYNNEVKRNGERSRRAARARR